LGSRLLCELRELRLRFLDGTSHGRRRCDDFRHDSGAFKILDLCTMCSDSRSSRRCAKCLLSETRLGPGNDAFGSTAANHPAPNERRVSRLARSRPAIPLSAKMRHDVCVNHRTATACAGVLKSERSMKPCGLGALVRFCGNVWG
jgi:hypothetical protein